MWEYQFSAVSIPNFFIIIIITASYPMGTESPLPRVYGERGVTLIITPI
jgi:hypothetical protein